MVLWSLSGSHMSQYVPGSSSSLERHVALYRLLVPHRLNFIGGTRTRKEVRKGAPSSANVVTG